MILSDLLKKISKHLAPNHSEELYQYLMQTSDDNDGFLRTRYCYWDKPLEDHKVADNIRTVLICTQRKVDFDNIKTYYEGSEAGDKRRLTRLKLQLFYYDLSDEEKRQDGEEWSKHLGYKYPVVVNIHPE